MAAETHGNRVGATTRTRGGRVIATFDTYADAEAAVDKLSDAKFPVERTAIIGRNPRFVEHVTGRVGYLDAMLRGALSGAMVGLLIGWLFAVFNWLDPTVSWGWLILDGLWFGTIVGALMGLLGHALSGGRRDFASITAMEAEAYELLVDDEVADEAARLLGLRAAGAEATPPAAPRAQPAS
jgi:hypothetical protein